MTEKLEITSTTNNQVEINDVQDKSEGINTDSFLTEKALGEARGEWAKRLNYTIPRVKPIKFDDISHASIEYPHLMRNLKLL